LAVGGSSSAAEVAAVSGGEGESFDGVSRNVELARMKEVVAADAQSDQLIEIGATTK
jgi:hypothetical protein